MIGRYLTQTAKALYAAAWTTLATLAVTLTGNQNFGDLTTLQWVIVAGAALGGFGGVYRLTNKPPA